jgi:dTDP-4-amino-4,6-dideoxygalactose transaminase
MVTDSGKPALDMQYSKIETAITPGTATPLAILGGTPAFKEKLHVGRPNIGDRARLSQRIDEILDCRWLTNNGPYVQEFEKRIAEMIGVKHCIAMCNATVALELAIRALDLSGEVILPSFTFVATAHALQWQQITPVFCDIDPSTYNINPREIEHLITPRTSGILAVHLWGRPCPIAELQAIADRHRLSLLFDAAHAFGCRYGGRMLGGFGNAEILSFHATKFINSGEGGAVVTNDDELAAKIRLMRNFGFSDYDTVTHIGINGKMTELSAAVGLTNLESIADFTNTNRANFEHYRIHLAGLTGIDLITYDERENPNYQYVVCRINSTKAGLSRDQFADLLHAENILARRYFYPGVHRMEPYRSLYPHARFLLPNTEAVAKQVLVLPTGTSVTADDIETICRIIRYAVENCDRVAGVLKATQRK